MLMKALIFYASGAVVVGALFASHQTVTAKWRGKPVKYPRLFAGIGAGFIWPWVLIKLVLR
jgi:hypothetical protein